MATVLNWLKALFRPRPAPEPPIPREFGPSDCVCGEQRPHTHFGDGR